MATFEVGRVVVKTTGREAAQKAVIVDFIDQNFVLITGAEMSKIKRRRGNMKHLEPTSHVLSIKRGAKDADIRSVAEKAGLIEEITTPITPEF